MRRREFITLLSGAAALPLAARAQPPTIPVIGFLNSTSLDAYRPMLNAFRQGLQLSGYVEDQNVTIEYRWAPARHSLPVMYEWPEFVRAGGLISYSTLRADAFIQSGIYVGRILNGAKPADLPVVQSTRFELTINLKTARRSASTCPRRCSPAPTR
jgi:hypothetical protein